MTILMQSILKYHELAHFISMSKANPIKNAHIILASMPILSVLTHPIYFDFGFNIFGHAISVDPNEMAHQQPSY